MMNTTTKTFRATTALAMLAVLALPFWQVASKAQADGGGTEPYFVEADQERMDLGITGYLVTDYGRGDMHIDVMSETRSAAIDFEINPALAEGSITVNVGSSGETLALTSTTTVWARTALINGTEVATWQHTNGDNWEFTNFDRLESFTSWHILNDVLSDENMQGEGGLPIETDAAINWIIVIAIVAVITLIVDTAGDAGLIAYPLSDCEQWQSGCADNDYDPVHSDCINWETNCVQLGMYDAWCEALFDQCIVEGQGWSTPCDIYEDYCMP